MKLATVEATIGKYVVLDDHKGIEVSVFVNDTKKNLEALYKLKGFWIGLDEPRDDKGHARGNAKAKKVKYEFSGKLGSISIPKPNKKGLPIKSVLTFPDSPLVVEGMRWIKSCDPATVMLLQTEQELEFPKEDDPEGDGEQQELPED